HRPEVNEVAMAISDNRAKEWDPMSDEKKNLPDGAAGEDHDTEKEIDSSAVSVGSETEEEGSSQTPEERLEQIAADHDVPVDRDPRKPRPPAKAQCPPTTAIRRSTTAAMCAVATRRRTRTPARSRRTEQPPRRGCLLQA